MPFGCPCILCSYTVGSYMYALDLKLDLVINLYDRYVSTCDHSHVFDLYSKHLCPSDEKPTSLSDL